MLKLLFLPRLLVAYVIIFPIIVLLSIFGLLIVVPAVFMIDFFLFFTFQKNNFGNTHVILKECLRIPLDAINDINTAIKQRG